MKSSPLKPRGTGCREYLLRDRTALGVDGPLVITFVRHGFFGLEAAKMLMEYAEQPRMEGPVFPASVNSRIYTISSSTSPLCTLPNTGDDHPDCSPLGSFSSRRPSFYRRGHVTVAKASSCQACCVLQEQIHDLKLSFGTDVSLRQD